MFLNFFKDLFEVLYPNYCIGCGQMLDSFEKHLCVSCLADLRETNFSEQQDNLMNRTLSLMFPLSCATALFFFKENNPVRNLLHYLKYKNQEKIGEWVGQWLSSQIVNKECFNSIDIVVPVPIHKEKLKKRKYNQVALFAKQLAKSLKADYVDDVLIKVKNIDSQTHKNRQERKENKNVFSIINSQKLEGKHILIVDDVITTGATIEQCAKKIMQIKNVTISVASIAYVVKNKQII